MDADLRRPKAHVLLNAQNDCGLADYLQGSADREAILHPTEYFGLTLVSAGNTTGHPSELLASTGFREALAHWSTEFDYIIVDTPPLHPISDVSFLMGSVDGVLLVVQANKTSKAVVKQAVESLPPNKVLGAVLNRSEEFRRGFGYKYGGGYYYGYY